MKLLVLAAILTLATTAFAHNHEEHKKLGHDKEHSHVEDASIDHEHDDAHHKAHDHKAHHPDHDDKKVKKKK